MCLVIFAHQVCREFPLIVAANRDEFHERPTQAAQLWPEHPELLAGKDLAQGGTWMGMTRTGRFAAITNFRGSVAPGPSPRSRGELTLNFLTGRQSPGEYLGDLTSVAGEYAGFNLLVGDRDSLWYFGNNDSGDPRALEPGVYGLSNASLDTPWPKVEQGKAILARLVEARSLTHEALAQTVSDAAMASPSALAAIGQHSEMERVLSSQFIQSPGYGTRATTTLRVSEGGEVHWREVSFDETGAPTGTSELVLTTD